MDEILKNVDCSLSKMASTETKGTSKMTNKSTDISTSVKELTAPIIIGFYLLAVLVITPYGHSCLCFMTCEAEPIMADL